MSKLDVQVQSRFKQLQRSKKEQRIPLMVSVSGAQTEHKAAPVNIIFVIDISLSMNGDKIRLVKDSIKIALEQLGDADSVGMVTFNDKAHKIFDITSVTKENENLMKKKVNKISANGNTSIFAGMKMAFELIGSNPEKKDFVVMLLSDGDENCGHNAESLKKHTTDTTNALKAQGCNVIVHSFGYGKDHNEAILSGISQASGGQFYYVKDNDLVPSCIASSFALTKSVTCKDINVEVKLSSSFKFEECLGQEWAPRVGDGLATLKISSLSAGQTRNFIAWVNTEKTNGSKRRSLNVCKVTAKTAGGETLVSKELRLTLTSAKTLSNPSQEVDAQLLRCEAADVMNEVTKKLEMGMVEDATQQVQLFKGKTRLLQNVPDAFKDKIDKLFEVSDLKDKKNAIQHKMILRSEQFVPGFESVTAATAMQTQMMGKFIIRN